MNNPPPFAPFDPIEALSQDEEETPDETTAPEAAEWLNAPAAIAKQPTLRDLLVAIGKRLDEPCPPIPPNPTTREYLTALAYAPNPPATAPNPETDAPTCPNCGALMQRSGSCHTCPDCGASNGCA